MSPLPHRRTPFSTAYRPRWDRLESRIALAAVLTTSPPPASTVTRTPGAITVTFDEPIDPNTLGFGDVVLDRVAGDGSLVPVFDPNNPPGESIDATGTVLSIDLSATVLAPGRYEIFLSGQNSLATQADETSLAPVDGNDEFLGEFTLALPGVGLADAVDLGSPGPAVTTVASSLDLAADPSAVKLFKITLGTQDFRRLGLEVATPPGAESPLAAALTLFDSQGWPLATSAPTLGADPYLFQGLGPGTYYVGVSAKDNVPGQPGGYDVATALAGSVAPSQPGGDFTLQVVADPVVAPTRVAGFRVDRADTLDPSPSGFTIQFSGAIDLGMTEAGVNIPPQSQVEVLDAAGRSWPIASAAFDQGPTQVTFDLADHLPAGTYSVVLPTLGGLTDLAGLPPRAAGLAPGVLATFSVSPGELPAGDDLGWISPDSKAPTKVGATLDPGTSASYRFTIAAEGLYAFHLESPRGGIAASVGRDGPGEAVVQGQAGPDDASFLQYLQPGHYRLFATNVGPDTSPLQASIRLVTPFDDSLTPNGLGQGSALGLRLATPDGPLNPPAPSASPTLNQTVLVTANPNSVPAPPPSPQPSTGTIPAPPPTAPGPAGPAFGPSVAIPTMIALAPAHSGGVSNPDAPASSSSSAGAANGPAGLFLAIGGTPVGRPGAEADHVASVGASGESGAVALAVAGPGLGQAVTAGILRELHPADGGPSPDIQAAPSVEPGPIAEPAAPPQREGQDAVVRLAVEPSTLPATLPPAPSPLRLAEARSDAEAEMSPEPLDPTMSLEQEVVADVPLWDGLRAPANAVLAVAVLWGSYRLFLQLSHPKPTPWKRLHAARRPVPSRLA